MSNYNENLLYGQSGVVAVWIGYKRPKFYNNEVLRMRTAEESERCANDDRICPG